MAGTALRASGRRVLRVTRTDRIGHLMGEIDCVLREEHLAGREPRGVVLPAPRGRVANRHVLHCWREHLTVVESPWLCEWLDRIAEHSGARLRDDMLPYFTAIEETARCYAIYGAWGDRAPLLTLSSEDVARGEAALRELGLPEGARFVCFHCRDGDYSPGDEHWHGYRNASVESYLPAMESLYERGLYGIRMGDPTMPPMPETVGVVDYAHSPLRSDWMDVFLCARCEFFLGNSSGLYLVSLAFGRPSALANLAPMSSALGTGPHDLGIPKLLWDEEEERLLGFREVMSAPLGSCRFAEGYREAGVRPIDNEPGDVTALALEMLERIRGEAVYEPADEALQAKYVSLFRPGHYAYGSSGRVGRDFLRKHAGLLGRGGGPHACR